MNNKRVNILGVGVSAIDMSKAVEEISGWQKHGEQHYVCFTGVHGVMESHRDESIREIHNNAGLVTPDGMPLVWSGRLKGYGEISRVYGPDLLLEICGNATFNECKHFFYGGKNSTLELLSDNLRMKFPDINIVGVFSPPFRPLTPEEDKLVTKKINQANPDFLWVGLSTPKQEIWMAEHIDKISRPIMIGVGAAFDFHAGVKKQAPLWMQRSGLEWSYRLLTEPRRLWRRYVVNNPSFVYLVVAQMLGVKKYYI